MLSYSEIKPRKYIIYNGEPYEVLSSHVSRKQQRKPVNQTKLKNLVTGSVSEISFKASDTADEADILNRSAKYLYTNNGEWWFCDPDNPKDRFTIEENVIGENGKFIKENAVIETLIFNDLIIGISLPIKITFEVTEAPPNFKGNTASGGDKLVTIETGASITTPMFIEAGDKIEINTQTGEYVQRINI